MMTYALAVDAICPVDHDHVGEFAARGPNVWGFTGPIHKIDSKINDTYLTNCGKYLHMKIKTMAQPLIFLTAPLDPHCKVCHF
jgi:mitochondrial fission protein ELM1